MFNGSIHQEMLSIRMIRGYGYENRKASGRREA
jgi:hypothetical protein